MFSNARLKNQRLRFIEEAVLCLLLMVGSGCGLSKMNGAGPAVGGVSHNAMLAFQKQVYPILTSATYCVRCHNGGASGAPLFAQSNVQNAATVAQGYLNIQSPILSELYHNATNSHEGSNVLSQSDAKVFLTALTTWATAMSSNGGGSQLIVSKQTFSLASVAGATAPVKFAFDLNQLSPQPTGLQGVTLTISVLPLGNGYTLATPTLINSNASAVGVHIQGIVFSISGVPDGAGDSFTSLSINATVPKAGTSYVINGQAISLNSVSSPDTLGLSFVAINSQPAAACKALSNFNTNVLPILNNNCVTCHKPTGNPAAYAKIRMTGVPDVCVEILPWITPASPENSPLIIFPTQQLVPAVSLTAQQISAIEAWASQE